MIPRGSAVESLRDPPSLRPKVGWPWAGPLDWTCKWSASRHFCRGCCVGNTRTGAVGLSVAEGGGGLGKGLD